MMQFPGQKNFQEKTDQSWRQDLQQTPTQMLKNKQLKMVFRTNRKSLKYTPKEFSKVNACAWDPPWCYKNTQFSRQYRSVTHTNPEWYVLTVSSAAPCSFDLQTTVSYYNFKLEKILSTLLPELAFTVATWYTNRCIPFYISAPNKEIDFFIFVTLLLILSFQSLTLVIIIIIISRW